MPTSSTGGHKTFGQDTCPWNNPVMNPSIRWRPCYGRRPDMLFLEVVWSRPHPAASFFNPPLPFFCGRSLPSPPSCHGSSSNCNGNIVVAFSPLSCDYDRHIFLTDSYYVFQTLRETQYLWLCINSVWNSLFHYYMGTIDSYQFTIGAWFYKNFYYCNTKL